MTYDIDPELAPIMELLPSLNIEDPVSARASFGDLIAMMASELDTSGVQIEDRDIPGIDGAPAVSVRVYQPEARSQEPTGGLLFIHGGGFVIGNLDSEQGSCLALCRDLGIVIVSVDYRLAPEYPYPSGLDDCYSGLSWFHENAGSLGVDNSRIAVYGQSAGGGLSAALALACRDREGPAICFQYLGIPELDDRLDTISMQAFTDTPMWSRPSAILSWEYYLGPDYQRGAVDVPVYAAPARAVDLAGLPPAYISTMEFDPLRDEGLQYGLKLLQAGVSAEIHSFPGTFHGSSVVGTAAVSRREYADTLAVLRRGLGLS